MIRVIIHNYLLLIATVLICKISNRKKRTKQTTTEIGKLPIVNIIYWFLLHQKHRKKNRFYGLSVINACLVHKFKICLLRANEAIKMNLNLFVGILGQDNGNDEREKKWDFSFIFSQNVNTEHPNQQINKWYKLFHINQQNLWLLTKIEYMKWVRFQGESILFTRTKKSLCPKGQLNCSFN